MNPACPISGCTAPQYPDRLLCQKHWEMVPAYLRWSMWEAFRVWRQGKLNLDGLRAAQQEAIAAVNEKLGVR
jgi:hypothetical protein